MLKDANKCLNNEYYYHTNHQLIGYKDIFGGVIVKDWVMINSNSVNFHPCDKVLVKNCVK